MVNFLSGSGRRWAIAGVVAALAVGLGVAFAPDRGGANAAAGTPPAEPAPRAADAGAAGAAGRRGPIQVGPHYPAGFNLEEPYANILHAGTSRWMDPGDGWKAVDPSILDRVTGLPRELPGGANLSSDLMFTGSDADRLSWDGDWVLKADCTGSVEIDISFAPAPLVRRKSPCHIEFTRDQKGKKTLYHHGVVINRLKGAVANLRLCRTENVQRCEAGIITSQRFADAVKGYDVIRYVNLQAASTALVSSVDEIAPPDAVFWGNATPREGTYKPPFVGMPIKAPFVMSVETDTMAWVHAPISLGGPSFDDPAIGRDVGKWRAAVKANVNSILESPEWDRYADAFVAALIESGYPADRPVYVALANEVWNFASEYFATTNYAWGFGEGLRETYGVQGHEIRTGYGALSARWRAALDAALARAGRDQNIVYLIESQAAWVEMSTSALAGAKWYVEHVGGDWAAASGDFGLSVASYWAANWGAYATPDDWKAKIAANPAGTMDAFERFIMTSPADFGAPWAFKVIAAHAAEAKKWGVPFIGFYEGGSHLERPDYIPKEWWTAFLWGPHGGRINAAVNEKLRQTYPDAILSNYVLAGPVGAGPWGEGPYGADNAYARSWDRFLRTTD